MSEINIRFRMNLETGLKDIIIEYDSDDDVMRHEHEKKHRDIVKQLLGAANSQAERLYPGELASTSEESTEDTQTLSQ